MLKLGQNIDIGGHLSKADQKMEAPESECLPGRRSSAESSTEGSALDSQPTHPRRHDIQQLLRKRSRSRSRSRSKSRSPSPPRVRRREGDSFQPSRNSAFMKIGKDGKDIGSFSIPGITAHAPAPLKTHDSMTSRLRPDPEAHSFSMSFFGVPSIPDTKRQPSNQRSPLTHDVPSPLKLNMAPYMDPRVAFPPETWTRHIKDLQEAHARQLQSFMYSQALADPLLRPYLSMAPHMIPPMLMTSAMQPMPSDFRAPRRSTGSSSETSIDNVISRRRQSDDMHTPPTSGRCYERQVTCSSRGVQAEDTDSEEEIDISVDVDDSSPTTTAVTSTPTTSRSERRRQPPAELSSPDTTTHSPGNSPPLALPLQRAPPALRAAYLPRGRLPLSTAMPFYAPPSAARPVPGIGLPPAHTSLGATHPGMFPFPSNGRRPRDPSKPPPLKKYKCDLCGKSFSRSNTLVTHRRIHTGEKPFKCEVCGRAFRQPGNLTRHRLTHTTVKPFVCPVCNKAFNRASNLHTHMRTHANFKPFICQYCGKSFNQKVDLKIHTYSHTGRPEQQ